MGSNKVRFYCNKVLPLVYDDSLSYYEVLCKLRDKINEMVEGIDDEKYTIKYADPIAWNITTQYEENVIVKDPDSGVLYLSKRPVPTGISLTNETYWEEIGDFSYQIEFIKDAVCATDEGDSLSATRVYASGDYLWWSDKFYKTKTSIAIGDYFSSSNLEEIDVSGELKELKTQVDSVEQYTTEYAAKATPANIFEGGHIKIFGDSNTVVNYIDEENRFYATVAKTFGMTYNCYGVSNTCFRDDVPNGNGGLRGNFRTQIENAPSDPDCKLVFILGGINDFHYGDYDESKFASAVFNTVDACCRKYPNATIVTMMDCGSQDPNGKMLRYAKLVQRYATSSTSTHGNKCIVVPSVDMFSNSTYWYNTNHYSQLGNNAIARRFVATIIGNGLANYSGVVRTSREYTQASPNSLGFYNCGYYVTTVVDPITCVRQDEVEVYIDPGFNNTDGETSVGSSTAIFDDIPALDNTHGQDVSQNEYITSVGVRQSSGNTIFKNYAFTYYGSNYSSLTESPKLIFRNQYSREYSDFDCRVRVRMHFISY